VSGPSRNECPVHGQPRFAHILACAHRGPSEVWLADQGDGTAIVYEIRDIAERERAYDALDRWTDTGEGGYPELLRLKQGKDAVERTTKAVDHATAQREFDAAVARMMAAGRTP
jgi:hypothetical protein